MHLCQPCFKNVILQVHFISHVCRAATIYNPSVAVGSRWSGLLADSGFDRLYHSGALLTTNGDVLIVGSEQTQNYG